MNRLPFASGARLLILIAAACAAAASVAQTPAAKQGEGQSPAAAAPARPGSDNQWLADTAKLYYSSARAGLTGFDCAIHPDWHTLFVSAGNGEPVAEDDARIALLNTVKITIHARMKGGSTIEWEAESNPDKPLDQNSTNLLDALHRSVEQSLEGFMQFWGPFMEASVVPDSSEGLEITHTPTVHTIHAKQGGTELTEIFSSDRVLEQFNVDMSGMSIKFSPAYTPTPQGLLVKAFQARIVPARAGPGQQQEMKVEVEYQSVGKFIIPQKLSMNVAGTGMLNFTFDGCRTTPE